MHSVSAPINPVLLASRLAALRIAQGTAECPTGPQVIPPAVRSSSFSGFPSGATAVPALNHASTIAAFGLGD
jgi:hypothetical protein